MCTSANRPPELGPGCLPGRTNGHAHRRPVARLARAALLLVSLPALSACPPEWQTAWEVDPDPELVRAVEENRVADAVRMARRGGNLYYRKRSFHGIDLCYGGILGLAAKKNHSEMVGRLIEAGVDPNPPIARQGPCLGALAEAARAGHAEIVRQLLDAGAHPDWGSAARIAKTTEKTRELLASWDQDPASRRRGGSRPLQGAIKGEHVEVVRLLLDAGAHSADSLIDAAETGNIEIARLLLDAGADPNHPPRRYSLLVAATPDHRTPGATFWRDWYPLSVAAAVGHPDMVRLLLDAGAHINGPESAWDTPLVGVALAGNPEIARMLLEAGVDIHVGNLLEKTAWYDNTEVARLLVEAGVDLESTAKSTGLTPLFIAAHRDNVDLLKLLIGAGASVHATNEHGTTPLMRAAVAGGAEAVGALVGAGAEIDATNEWGSTALALAVSHRHAGVVRQLLDAGADPDRAGDRGMTALQHAAGQGNPDIVGILVEAGADVGYQNRDDHATGERVWMDGATPLILAAGATYHRERKGLYEPWKEEGGAYFFLPRKDGTLYPGYPERYRAGEPSLSPDPGKRSARVEIVRQLLAAGADVNATHRGRGTTALFGAASTGRPEIVRLLLEAGADPSVVNLHGMTAVQVAVRAGHPAIAEVIYAAADRL